MGTYYDILYSNGDRCNGNERMYVMLYPNTASEFSNCGPGTHVTSPLQDACDQLYYANSVVYYDISRFKADSYNYPNVDTSSRDNISTEFENFLTNGNNNGTGMNLKDIRGCHMLVHGDPCSVYTAGGEAHDTCNSGGTAFSRGTMAWTGLCGTADRLGLRKNSSIQECIHQFIRANDSDIRQPLLGDGDNDGVVTSYDEHSLGVINSSQEVTPMLTYHGEEFQKAGECKRSSDTVDGYEQTLTSCTEEAVSETSHDQCNPQNGNIC